MTQKTCAKCDAPIKPQFNICYNCFTEQRGDYVNRCEVCDKPIADGYSLCYQHHMEALQPRALANPQTTGGE